MERQREDRMPPARHRGLDRILIVRLGSMGDIIHSLPAVATLRRALPEAQIDWVVEDRWSPLLCSRAELQAAPRSPEKPLVDRVYVVDTRAWRKALTARATHRAAGSVVRRLREARYDVAIDLQGAVKSAFLMRLAGAHVRFGFSRPIESPAGLVYTRRVVARGRHIAEQNVSLAVAAAASAGIAADPVYEFPLPADAGFDAWAQSEIQQRRMRGFALMTPGAGWGAKRWPAERFGAVARVLGDLGLSTIVNYGPGEKELADAVLASSGGAAQALACSIGELMALTRRARIFIGGDTGPTHLAAALGVPVVGIYGPTDPGRNGPMGGPSFVLRSERSVTSHARRKQAESGLLEISADQVADAARQLLGAEPAR
jgi:heptosyltransferase-1